MGSASTPRAETFALRADGPVVEMGQDTAPADSPAPPTRFDACPAWLELAVRHLSDAQVAHGARTDKGKDADEHSTTGALEWEFETSMQATMACAVAVDAFYAVVQTRVPLPSSLIHEWRDRQAPRHVRIADVFGRAFSLAPDDVSGLARTLEEIFSFRDLAINPSGKMDVRIAHPELGVDVEWRFASFRYENALMIVKATVRVVAELAGSAHLEDTDLRTYIDALRPRLEALQTANALRARAQKRDIG